MKYFLFLKADLSMPSDQLVNWKFDFFSRNLLIKSSSYQAGCSWNGLNTFLRNIIAVLTTAASVQCQDATGAPSQESKIKPTNEN